MTPAELSVLLFALLNVARTAAYVPQLVRIYRDREGAVAVSVVTWALFAAANLATVAYAILHSGDAVMAGVFSFNALGCLAIVGLTLWKRFARPPGAAFHVSVRAVMPAGSELRE